MRSSILNCLKESTVLQVVLTFQIPTNQTIPKISTVLESSKYNINMGRQSNFLKWGLESFSYRKIYQFIQFAFYEGSK